MSNLSNLMISGSYLGLINLQDSTQNLASQSGDVQLQDGVGDNIGLTINAQTKEFTVVNNFKVDGDSDFNGNVDISGSLTHTGSIDIVGDLTIQGDVTANVGNFDTVNARLLNITEESASVIFSSGSNVLGDEETDRQDLIGQVIVSGTLGVEGSSSFTGSLTVSNEISSSTLNGIGNVTSYSASVDSRLDDLEFFSSSEYQTASASFDNRLDQLEAETGSQVQRLNSLEAFTGSQETINGFYNSFTASNGNDSLNAYTASQDIINSNVLNFTSSQESINGFFNQHTESLNDYTSSANSRFDNLEAFTSSFDVNFVSTGSFNAYTQSTDNVIATLATTGSNTFIGNNTFNGSVNGDVVSLTITSQTASIDYSEGNFFTLTLPDSITDTHLVATNIQAGQTSNVRINTSGSGSVTFSSDFQFPVLNSYIASATNTTDILTFVTFDTSLLYGVAVKRLG